MYHNQLNSYAQQKFRGRQRFQTFLFGALIERQVGYVRFMCKLDSTVSSVVCVELCWSFVKYCLYKNMSIFDMFSIVNCRTLATILRVYNVLFFSMMITLSVSLLSSSFLEGWGEGVGYWWDCFVLSIFLRVVTYSLTPLPCTSA